MAAATPSYRGLRDGSDIRKRRLTIIAGVAIAVVAYVGLILLVCTGTGGGGSGGRGSDGVGDGAGGQEEIAGTGGADEPRNTPETVASQPDNVVPEAVEPQPEPPPPVMALQQQALRPPAAATAVSGVSGGGTAGEGGGQGGGQGGGDGPGAGPRPMGTGDVSFRIYWEPRIHDIDLHVVDPEGHHIWYNRKNCPCSGCLDRDDQNSGGPENVFWPRGEGPNGDYTFYVVYYAGTGEKQVTIEVRRQEEIVDTKRVVLRLAGETSDQFLHRMD